MGNYRPNNYQPRHSWHMDWTDERHPKIKTMMSSYLEPTAAFTWPKSSGRQGRSRRTYQRYLITSIQMEALSCAGRACLGDARIANAISTNRGDILIQRISATNSPIR